MPVSFYSWLLFYESSEGGKMGAGNSSGTDPGKVL